VEQRCKSCEILTIKSGRFSIKIPSRFYEKKWEKLFATNLDETGELENVRTREIQRLLATIAVELNKFHRNTGKKGIMLGPNIL
jgi:hypothetical protein